MPLQMSFCRKLENVNLFFEIHIGVHNFQTFVFWVPFSVYYFVNIFLHIPLQREKTGTKYRQGESEK